MSISIAQISDIHIGGEYNGKFDCVGNLRKIIDVLSKRQHLDYLIVTGDIADNHDEEEYIEFDTQIHKLKMVFKDIKILAVGGNHDDFLKMHLYAHDYEVVEGYYQPLDSLFLNVTEQKIGLTEFQRRMVMRCHPQHVFMHYPVGDCQHKFMHVPERDMHDVERTARFFRSNYVKNVFCGHYHNAAHYDANQYCPSVHICPSIQTQLDPNSDVCVPNDTHPGYALIELDDKDYHLISVNHFMYE